MLKSRVLTQLVEDFYILHEGGITWGKVVISCEISRIGSKQMQDGKVGIFQFSKLGGE